MAGRKVNFTQFSKKLAKYVLIFWGIIRVLNFIVIALRPESGGALVSLQHGADDIAMAIVIAYTCNSLGEKVTTKIADGYFARERESGVTGGGKDKDKERDGGEEEDEPSDNG